MTTTVTALLVSHDGDRWLGAVLDGLAAQSRPPDRCVAVDSGSTDASPQLLRERLAAIPFASSVLERPHGTGYAAAVRAGLDILAEAPDEWVWLLHDDSAPAPDALEQLLAATAAEPSADLLGPKLREWPSLRRLLEVGVTISGTGRRETGLESGEYDQGQHDRLRDVLAVNTAGMLVRRSVLESLGLDPRLPVVGADLDLGWRAARAGYRTVVAPEAVVFHVEAARRGVRRTSAGGSGRRAERAAALYVLLVNGPPLGLPLRVVRLLLGSLLRVLGLLLVRAPGEALDELAALVTTYARPRRVVAGRRERRRTAVLPHRDVRHLLAPWWLPYRHGVDAVGDFASAVAHAAGDRSSARRERALEPAAPATTLVLLLVLVVAAAVGARGLVGSGALTGGALLPAPDGASDWWHGYLASSHPVGTGSSAPAAPYLLPLAALGTLLVGQAGLVVDLLFLLAVPLAAWGGYRFLRQVGASGPASLWGAAAYGVLPVVTGSVQQGRLGTVAAALLLPWLAHAAVFLRSTESADRRARASWRSALWLAVLVGFVPVTWVLAAVLAVLGVAATPGMRRGRTGRSVLVPLVASLVLLLPWSVAVWSHQGAASLLLEAGLPAPDLVGHVGAWDAVFGRPGAGAPGWVSAGIAVAALAALLRPDTRVAVLRAWLVVVVALGAAALLASLSVGTGTTPAQPVWLGFPLVLAQAAGITAAALAGSGLRGWLATASFGWRQPVGVLVAAAAVLTPVLSLGWWVAASSAGPLQRQPATDLPAYLGDAAREDPATGVLELRGTSAGGYRFVLLHQAGLRLGDDAVMPSRSSQARLTSYVGDLVSSPTPADIAGLSRLGVGYVFAAAPADPALAGALDSASGLTRGGASGRGDRAWQLEATPAAAGPTGGRDPARPWLLAVQGVAVVVSLVLAAPSRGARR